MAILLGKVNIDGGVLLERFEPIPGDYRLIVRELGWRDSGGGRVEK